MGQAHQGTARFAEWWLFALVLLPVLTQYLETGHWPHTPREALTEVGLTLCIWLLVLALRWRHRQLLYLSETDLLTGLSNRRKFEFDLQREVARANRFNTPLVLAFLDIDRFKLINDTLGHAEGDRVLQQLARLFSSSVRSQVDCCYRIGGDEFALLLPGREAGKIDGIMGKIEGLSEQAVQLLGVHGAGLSLGAAVLGDGEAPERFLHRADCLMYEKKLRGEHPARDHEALEKGAQMVSDPSTIPKLSDSQRRSAPISDRGWWFSHPDPRWAMPRPTPANSATGAGALSYHSALGGPSVDSASVSALIITGVACLGG